MKNEKRGGGVGESVDNVEEEELKVQSYPQSETAATFQTRHEYIRNPPIRPLAPSSILNLKTKKERKKE